MNDDSRNAQIFQGRLTYAKNSVRPTLRAAALEALSLYASTTGRHEELLSTPRVHFLYTHSVPGNEEAQFRALLTELARKHTFLPYSDAVDRIRTGNVDRPYVSFSFDDAFHSNLRTARILKEFGTTGCFFVPTAFVGISTQADAESYFRTSQHVEDIAMSWANLESLVDSGHEIGSHTISHPNCSTLSRPQLDHEFGESRSELETKLGVPVEHLAWPYGRFFHFSNHAREAASQAGYKSIASAERGSHLHGVEHNSQPLCIRRDQFMTKWPQRHTMHFVATSARSPLNGGTSWPKRLRPEA